MSILKPTVGLDAIYQEIDLGDVTGLDLSDYRGVKEAIGQAMVDHIRARTLDNRSYEGGKLKSPYSKQYQKSLKFKAAGKSARDINMTLTGDMLASLDVEMGKESAVRVIIDSEQVPKAYNHITGDTVPKRNFFGLKDKELTAILEDFSDDLDQIRQDQASVSDDTPERGDKIKAIDFLNQQDGEEDN